MVITYILYPLIWLLNAASNVILRATGVKLAGKSRGSIPHTEAELRALVTQAVAEGTIGTGNAQLLTSAFEFQDLGVRQIMTPRTKVDFLLIDQALGKMLKTVQKSAYSRMPLCDGDLDHVVGMVHMKDLFALLNLTPGRLRLADEKTRRRSDCDRGRPPGFGGSRHRYRRSGSSKNQTRRAVHPRTHARPEGAPADAEQPDTPRRRRR